MQSYGPESRGGACSAQVIVSDAVIQYPYINTPDVLVCMSQSAYDKYKDQLKAEGLLLTDRDLVKTDGKRDYFAIFGQCALHHARAISKERLNYRKGCCGKISDTKMGEVEYWLREIQGL